MGKSVFTFPCKNFESTDSGIRQILIASGYKEKIIDNEKVWKKGSGFWSAMKLIKIDYGNDSVKVWGWVQTFDKPMELTGLIGCIPKKNVLNTIEQIKLAIR